MLSVSSETWGEGADGFGCHVGLQFIVWVKDFPFVIHH